ncbi:MAG: polysaccharide deacetylase family protein [Deltaproteobacteria bacterium]|nr:polysaccharide deacetylase family protein [Deltaproteobacteria bacterium]
MGKRGLKVILGFCLYKTGIYRWFLRDTCIIALFHRLDNDMANCGITMSVKKFQRYCDFFQKYFLVIKLEELLKRLEAGQDISRHAVITFDDGYKDNYELAAKELTDRRLSACFFIATGFINTTRIPFWDEEKSIHTMWMSWNDVRKLYEQGFEIGAHTVNHIDLGKISGEESTNEITNSKRILEIELGIPDLACFSYPFGGKHHMLKENVEIVRKAGFKSCLSAYGGVVTPHSDLFDLNRIPITNWYISPYQFGFELIYRYFRESK